VGGFLGVLVRGIEDRNPEALMEAAQSEFRARMAQYNQALARMAGLAERLKSQIKLKTAKGQDLERRIMANHRAGNLDLAGSLARELQDLRPDLATDTQELAETEDAYQTNLRQAKVAQKEFAEKIARLERQLSQVKVKEAQAEAAAGLGNVAFTVGDLGDTMKSVQDILNKRLEASAGKARLARDMNEVQGAPENEGERKALEQAALADFLASQGVQMTQADQNAPAAKEIGPGEMEKQL
jgi:phage shock protein A